jgi:hypothetical protein
MSRKTQIAHVIPLHPDASACVARGWHGMTERPHAQYTKADWAAWAIADPAGNARIVDVAPWSPAFKAGIISDDWVVSLDGECLDLWEQHGAAVGACIHVTGYRAGPWALEVVLGSRPARQLRQRQPRPMSFPQVTAGRRVGPKERLQWQAALSEDPALPARAIALAVRLSAKYADKYNAAWPGRARLARDLGVTVSTIDRMKARLSVRGWLKWMSGRRTGETNRYWMTWPAGW